MPIISVIIPCFNNSDTILQTIESVNNQTFKDLEIIVVNDGSIDDTENSVKSLKCQNLKYYNINNQGSSFARNYGIEKSTGKYLFFLDADDIIDETYLIKCFYILENNNEAKIVYAKASFFEAKTGSWDLPKFELLNFLKQNCIHISSMVRKIDVVEAGFFDINLTLMEDWDLWIRLIKNNEKSVHLIEETLFHYRKRFKKNSLTNTLHKTNTFDKSYIYIYNKNYEYYKKAGLDIVSLLNSEKENLKYKRKFLSIWYIKIFYSLRKIIKKR